MIEEIKACLEKALEEAEIHVTSADEAHAEATVIAKQFIGKSRLEQHQLVMGPLTELFASSLHALHLKTYTPTEWESIKGRLP